MQCFTICTLDCINTDTMQCRGIVNVHCRRGEFTESASPPPDQVCGQGKKSHQNGPRPLLLLNLICSLVLTRCLQASSVSVDSRVALVARIRRGDAVASAEWAMVAYFEPPPRPPSSWLPVALFRATAERSPCADVCPGRALGERMIGDTPEECLGDIFHSAPGVHTGTPGGIKHHVPPK